MKEETIVYDKNAQGFTSFQTFIPDVGISLNNRFFTFNRAAPWEHNIHDDSSNRNEFYGATDESYVDVVMNDAPTLVKKFKTLSYEGDEGWEIDLATDLESEVLPVLDEGREDIPRRFSTAGYVPSDDWEKKEGSYFAWIRSKVPTPEDVDLGNRGVMSLGPGAVVVDTGDETIFRDDIAEDKSIIPHFPGNLVYNKERNRWELEISKSFDGLVNSQTTKDFYVYDTKNSDNFFKIENVGSGVAWNIDLYSNDSIVYDNDDAPNLPTWLKDKAWRTNKNDDDEDTRYLFRTVNWTGEGKDGGNLVRDYSASTEIQGFYNLEYNDETKTFRIKGEVPDEANIAIVNKADVDPDSLVLEDDYFYISSGDRTYDSDDDITSYVMGDDFELPQWAKDLSFSTAGSTWRTSRWATQVFDGSEPIIFTGTYADTDDLSEQSAEYTSNISLTKRTDDAEAVLRIARGPINPISEPDSAWALVDEGNDKVLQVKDLEAGTHTDLYLEYKTKNEAQYETLKETIKRGYVDKNDTTYFLQTKAALDDDDTPTNSKQTLVFGGSQGDVVEDGVDKFKLTLINNFDEVIAESNQSTHEVIPGGDAEFTYTAPSVRMEDPLRDLGNITFNGEVTGIGSVKWVDIDWYYSFSSNNYTAKQLVENGIKVDGKNNSQSPEYVPLVKRYSLAHNTDYDIVAVLTNGGVQVYSDVLTVNTSPKYFPFVEEDNVDEIITEDGLQIIIK